MALPPRESSLTLLQEHVKGANMLKHCLAAEAVLRAIAGRLSEDAELWGRAGLLHDLDVELVNADPKTHGPRGAEMLLAAGYPPELAEAVRMHNEKATGQARVERFHIALAAGEMLTGLVTATALVYPDKKLASVKPSSIVKRMKEKLFAASVDRDCIRECEKIGIPLPEFAELGLVAMRGISADLGL